MKGLGKRQRELKKPIPWTPVNSRNLVLRSASNDDTHIPSIWMQSCLNCELCLLETSTKLCVSYATVELQADDDRLTTHKCT